MKMSNEVKIGLMGTVALVVLFFGINFLKGMSLFSSENVYYIQFKNAKGLSKNSTVFADGFNIGRVSDVVYDYTKPGQVVVVIAVDKNLRIPLQSKVALDEGMLGGCTLNMRLYGDTSKVYAPGDTIVGGDSEGMMEKASSMIPKVEPILARMDSLLATLNRLASNPALAGILNNTEELTRNLNQSSVQLNRLLSKDLPQMTNTFTKAGENIVAFTENINKLDMQATLQSVNSTVNNVNTLLARMQSPNGTLGKLINDSSLYENLNNTAFNANELVKDLKAHPKRYVHFSIFGKKDKEPAK